MIQIFNFMPKQHNRLWYRKNGSRSKKRCALVCTLRREKREEISMIRQREKRSVRGRLLQTVRLATALLLCAALLAGGSALAAYDDGYEYKDGVNILMKDGSSSKFYRGSNIKQVRYWRYNDTTKSHEEILADDIRMVYIPYLDSGDNDAGAAQSVVSFVNSAGKTEDRGFCISNDVNLRFDNAFLNYNNYHYAEIGFDELNDFFKEYKPARQVTEEKIEKIRFIVDDIRKNSPYDAAALAMAQAAIWYWTGEKQINSSTPYKMANTAFYHCKDGVTWALKKDWSPGAEDKHAGLGYAKMDLTAPVYGRKDVSSYLALYDMYVSDDTPGLKADDTLTYVDGMNVSLKAGTGFAVEQQQDGKLLYGPYEIDGTLINDEKITLGLEGGLIGEAAELLNKDKKALSGTLKKGDTFYLLVKTPAALSSGKITASFTAERDFTDIFVAATVDKKDDLTVESWTQGSQALMGAYTDTATKTQTATIAVDLYDVTLTKVDADDNTITLNGATFTLQHKVNDKYVAYSDAVYTTANEGTFTIRGLPAGDYQLTETKAPAGYGIIGDDKTTFTLPNNELEDNTLALTVENEQLYEIVVIKHDAARFDGTKDNPYSPLKDASFSLQLYNSANATDGKDGYEEVATGKTDASGKLSFKALCEGQYRLVETQAPSGYKALNEPIEITLPNDKLSAERSEDGYFVHTEYVGNERKPSGGRDPDPKPDPDPDPDPEPDPDPDPEPKPDPDPDPEPEPDPEPDPEEPTRPPDDRPLIPNDDGSFTVVDDDGTPLGTWRYDPETEEWILDEEIPLGAMHPVPQTDDPSSPLAMLCAMLAALGGAAVLFFWDSVRTTGKRQKR